MSPIMISDIYYKWFDSISNAMSPIMISDIYYKWFDLISNATLSWIEYYFNCKLYMKH